MATTMRTRRSSRERSGDADGHAAAVGNGVTSADDESEADIDGEGEGDDIDEEEDDIDEEDDDEYASDDSMDSTADMEVNGRESSGDSFESAEEAAAAPSRTRSSTQSTALHDFFTPANEKTRRSSTSTGESRKKKRKSRSERSERAERIRNRRRKIADVRDDAELDESTRKARDAERERASHLIDFEKLGDDDIVEIAISGEVVSDLQQLQVQESTEQLEAPRICLNIRPDGSTPTGAPGSESEPVYVHESIAGKLKKHQIIGAQFLWSHIAFEPHGFGCVLADFMGLGKTLQVITTVQAFLAKKRMNKDGLLVPRHKHVLILAPTICVRNWEAEVVKWLGKKEARMMGLSTLESSREKKMTDRVHVVKQWYRRGGLLIMGYELYRLLVLQSSGDEKIAAGNSKHAHLIKDVYKCLADPGPDLIVLDEGHRVRDHKSKLVKALSHVKTSRRIILTGYPLQNHLEEYWTMVNFARPDYLGTLEEFKNRFVDPIENGQCIDSSEADLRLARQRAYVLTRELKPLVLRRDQQYLFKQLPPKKEWVLLCKLSESQTQLYRAFLEQGVPKRGEIVEGFGGKVDVLGGYHISLAISNHPDVLCESYEQLESEMLKNPAKFMKSHNNRQAFQLNGEDLDGDFGLSDLSAPRAKSHRTPLSAGGGQMNSDESDMDILEALAAPTRSAPNSIPQHRLKFAEKFMRSYEKSHLASSGKMVILMQILAECQEIGDRVILFSQSIPTLNTIEKMISQANRSQRRHSKRLSYLRIDGSTPQQERFRMIGQFNDLEEDVDIIMISTKAGGEGINLCAGNRIIIFDVCWNPCNDSQSMCRSYRFGQLKPVFVYRFVTSGTMEKKVYDLQIRKEGVAKRIVDEKTMERKFKSTDLQNYFNLEEFEQSLQQQQQKASERAGGDTSDNGDDLAMRSPPETDEVLQKVLAKMSGRVELDAMAAFSSASSTDTASSPSPSSSTAESGWIVDWFEQETMFEEDLDQQCSPTEQLEIMESHNYLKALRRMRKNGSHLISREGVLVVKCQYCQVSNEIYPESTTNVPVPKSIDCMYCKRPTPTEGAAPPPVHPGVPPGGVPHPMYHVNGIMVRSGVPGAPPAVGARQMVDVGNAALASANASVAGRVLPPNLMAIYQQQNAARDRERLAQIRESNARQQRELQKRQDEMRRKERQALRLGERCLLVLRRGMKGCQDLKRNAESCGAKIAIEVNSQLTDIVSAMSEEESVAFLKLTKLPKDVDFHDDMWLRNEIAKAQGLPLVSSGGAAPSASAAFANRTAAAAASPESTHTDASRGESEPSMTADASSDMIELLDSDEEGEVATRVTTNHGTSANSTSATGGDVAEVDDEDDEDDDVIEIL